MIGKHLICDMYGCDQRLLDDQQFIENALIEAQNQAKAHILNVYVHKFEPVGVTAIVQVAESHISMHTYPEYGYQQIDIFTCGSTDVEAQFELLLGKFNCKRYTVSLIERGAIGEFDRAYEETGIYRVSSGNCGSDGSEAACEDRQNISQIRQRVTVYCCNDMPRA